MDNIIFYFTIVIVILLWIAKKLFEEKETLKDLKIPHFKPLPLLGNTLPTILQRENFIEFGDRLYDEFSKKKIFGFETFLGDYTLIISDPALIKQITIKDFEYFVNRDRVDPSKVDKYLGKSVLMLRDQKWKEMRANLSPVFTSAKMKQMFKLLQESAIDFVSFHETKALKAQGRVVVDTNDAFARVTADGIATTTLGFQGDCVRNENSEIFEIAKAVDEDFANPRTVILLNSFPGLYEALGIQMFRKKIHKFFETNVLGEIRRRRHLNIQRADVIQLLMQAQDGKLKVDGEDTLRANYTNTKVKKIFEWTDEDLIAQALVFFLGGFDTTTTLLQACFWELMRNPDVQQTLIDEVDEMLQKLDGHEISYEQLNQMKYLEMVVNESLRKWPSFRITSRLCTKDYVLQRDDGQTFNIRKGKEIFIPIGSIQNDPKYFKNPEVFDPERFSDGNQRNFEAGTFMPFGMGPRICIGSRYALLEAKLLLFSVIARFKIEKCDGTPEKLVLSNGTSGFKGKILVAFKVRNFDMTNNVIRNLIFQFLGHWALIKVEAMSCFNSVASKMFREVIVLVLGLIVAIAAVPLDFAENGLKTKEVESFVVGGSAASLGQFPYQAALRTPAGLFFCGGAIISNRWVVSAAHCTINRDLPISFRIVVGTLNFATGTEFPLSRVVNHPQYNRDTIANDVSLVQVQGTFTFGAHVNQVAMASAFIGAGQNGLVAGWGAVATGGAPTNQLQWFQTTTLTNADCQSRFNARGETRAASFVFAHKVCTFSRAGQGFCQGDSGGGLVIGGQVHGIVSWNIGVCGAGIPDVYDRISSHRAWITSITGF